MRSKGAWPLILLALCVIFGLQDANGQSVCTWKLRLGRAQVDPLDAPQGVNKYVISTTGKEGLTKVASELKLIQSVSDEDVSQLREMTTLGNIITAKMSKRALIWLCQQDELDGDIKFVEIDQQVSLFTGPGINPSTLTSPPVLEI